ncbi:MAG: Rhs element Vgr protein [Flavobacteriales bacterium]|jgi:Rhs element Vgr protein
MAKSPINDDVGLLSLEVSSEGSKIPETYQLQSLNVQQQLNRIAKAQLMFFDGSGPKQDFIISDAKEFEPGKKITIKLGYKNKTKEVYTGIVISTKVIISEGEGPQFEVMLKDEAIKMTIGRKNAFFTKKKDSEIIKGLIGEHSLNASVKATEYVNPTLIQHYCTDWDFLLSRAELNGFVVTTTAGKIEVEKPTLSAKEVLKVTYGIDMNSFDAELNASTQIKSVQGTSWDYTKQEIVQSKSANPTVNKQGNIPSDKLSKVLGLGKFELQTGANVPPDVLKSWADAQIQKSWLNRITGTASFQGNASVVPGCVVLFDGVGDRFNGKAYISKVDHRVSNGNWETFVHMGMPNDWHIEKPDVTAPLAGGLLPGQHGLSIGIVSKLDEDPDKEFRIKIKLPLLQKDSEGVWARLGTLSGGVGSGTIFVPSVGDEVIVGFINDDPGNPIILGSVYSSTRTPANDLEDKKFSLTPENHRRAIVTPEKNRIEFDDKKKVITVSTPGKNKIIADDEAKGVTVIDQHENKIVLDDKGINLTDKNGNKIVMDSSGIAITSAKEIKLDAGTNLSGAAKQNIDLKATSNFTGAGLSVKLNANTEFKATGNASAEISASGTTTVKGAMVMIN